MYLPSSGSRVSSSSSSSRPSRPSLPGRSARAAVPSPIARAAGSKGTMSSFFRSRIIENGWGVPELDVDPTGLVREALSSIESCYADGGVLETPLVRVPWLEEATGGSRAVRLKLESAQRGGSYKARGATHLARHLSDAHLARGVVTASGGGAGDASNLGAALARAVAAERRRRGVRGAGAPARVFVRRQGLSGGVGVGAGGGAADARPEEEREEIVEVAEEAGEEDEAARGAPSLLPLSFSPPWTEARTAATLTESPFVHPYGDVRLLGGHGGMALEVLSRSTPDDLDVVYLPVGGGSLLAATAAVLKTLAPGVRVVACAAEGAQGALEESLEASEKARDRSARAAQAGGAGDEDADAPSPASPRLPTLALSSCARYVDEWMAVPERAVARAMALARAREGLRVEPGGALALAGAMLAGERNRGRAVVVVVSGGNVDEQTLQRAEDIAHAAAR